MIKELTLADIIANVLALLSLVLSFYNIWRDNLQERVRIKLTPVTAGFKKDGQVIVRLGWNIVNLSNFSIDIQEIGYASCRRKLPFFRLRSKRTYKVVSSLFYWGSERLIKMRDEVIIFPINVKMRETLTLISSTDEDSVIAKQGGMKYIYVRTLCGSEFYVRC